MASPNVSFDTIPSSLRYPGQYFEFNNRLALQGLPANLKKLLLIGQRITPPNAWAATTAYTAGNMVRPTTANGHYYVCQVAGTSGGTEPTWPTAHGDTVADGAGNLLWLEFAAADASKSVETVYQLFSDADGRDLGGEGSPLHLMAKAVYAVNRRLQVFALALADNGTTKATGTVTITGPATGTGWVKCYVGDELVEVSFASGDSATDIATALRDAINETSDLGVIATNSAGVVTLTARCAGTIGNFTALETSYLAGVGVTSAASAAYLASGSTDPDIDDALDIVVDQRYHLIAPSWNDSTQLLKLRTHLILVSGALEQRPGRGIVGYVGALADAQTLADALNNERLAIGHLKACRSAQYQIGAAFAAATAGEEDPAMILNGLALTGIAPPPVGSRTTQTEGETLLHNGVTPLITEDETVKIGRSVSTFQTDESYLDTTTVDTLDYVRDALVTMAKARYARSKLSSRTPASVRSDIYETLKKIESLEIVENVDLYADDLVVERDLQNSGMLDAKIPADVVNGLHVLAGRIDLIL